MASVVRRARLLHAALRSSGGSALDLRSRPQVFVPRFVDSALCVRFLSADAKAAESGGASTEAATSSEGGGGGESREQPSGPRLLWTAPPLKFQAAQDVINYSAATNGCGLGLALLGIAPFVPPTPFMFGLLLAVLQVNLAHTWLTRQLHMQVRRHIVEVTAEDLAAQGSPEGTAKLWITCDGGLKRVLNVVPASEDLSKPPLEDVMQFGSSFLFLDKKVGKAKDQEGLDALLVKSQSVIESDGEEFTVEPLEFEGVDDAKKLVQLLEKLTKEHLQGLSGKPQDPPPTESLERLALNAQRSGVGILVGGLLICVGGRGSASAMDSAAA